MEWFRFYHDAIDDPKVQRLSPQLFKHWINLLCLASRNPERGTLPKVADIAFGMRLSEAKVRGILAELRSAGLLDGDGETLLIHNWNARQKRSDNVSERVAKYRASNAPVTLHETFPETLPHVRVKETETDTETEQIPPQPPARRGEYSAEFETWFQQYPRGRGSKREAFVLWQRLTVEERQSALDVLPLFKAGGDWKRGYHPAPEVWLRGKRWENPPPEEIDEGLANYRAFFAGAAEPPRVGVQR